MTVHQDKVVFLLFLSPSIEISWFPSESASSASSHRSLPMLISPWKRLPWPPDKVNYMHSCRRAANHYNVIIFLHSGVYRSSLNLHYIHTRTKARDSNLCLIILIAICDFTFNSSNHFSLCNYTTTLFHCWSMSEWSSTGSISNPSSSEFDIKFSHNWFVRSSMGYLWQLCLIWET